MCQRQPRQHHLPANGASLGGAVGVVCVGFRTASPVRHTSRCFVSRSRSKAEGWCPTKYETALPTDIRVQARLTCVRRLLADLPVSPSLGLFEAAKSQSPNNDALQSQRAGQPPAMRSDQSTIGGTDVWKGLWCRALAGMCLNRH